MRRREQKLSIGRRIKGYLNDRQFFAFLCLLYYPFNNTISDRLIFGAIAPFIFLVIGLILLIPDFKHKITKKSIVTSGTVLAIVVFLIINNKIFGTGLYNISQFILQISYLLLLPVLINIKINSKSFTKALRVFAIEHLIGTALPVLAPHFYSETVLSFICKGRKFCFAQIGFNSGINAGFTSHYSTNGCYLTIAALFFASLSMDENRKKSDTLLLILSIVALLIIGKRAHLIFATFSIIVGYIVSTKAKKAKHITTRSLKILIITLTAIISFIPLSQSIPQISTTIDRIIESNSSNDITNGRQPLYNLAIDEWKKSPIIGNGWGRYIQASHEVFGSTKYHVDYIHAHNDYLELLCDCGIVGLMLYLIVLFYLLIKYIRKTSPNANSILKPMLVLFYILYGITGTPLSIPSIYVTQIIIIAIEEKYDEKNRSNYL